MSYFLSEAQIKLTEYLRKNKKQIPKWAHTGTIAALMNRKAIDLRIEHNRVYIFLTKQGQFLHDLGHPNYKEALKEASQMRKRK